MHSSRRLCLVIAVCATFAPAVLGAAAQTYLLRVHQGKGDRAVYAVSATSSAAVAAPGQPATKTTSTANLTYAASFRGLSSDQTIGVQAQVLGGSVSAKAGGQSQTAAVAKSVTSYRVTPRAEVKEEALVSGTLPIISSAGTVLTADDAFLPLPLPAKPVKVGDRWQGRASLPLPAGKPGETRELRYDSKVLGQVAFAGRTCLKIKTSFSQSQRSSGQAPGGSVTLKLSAHGSGDIVWLFDPREGLVMKADKQGSQSVAITGPAPDGGERTAHITSRLAIHATMTEYNGKKVAAK